MGTTAGAGAFRRLHPGPTYAGPHRPFRPMRLLTTVFLLVTAPAFAQGRLSFVSERHDFGQFEEGLTVTTYLAFTNEGDVPVTLTEVRPSCGCTTPSYPTGAIAPGGTGEIVVAYNSEGRPGPFEKHVTVVADGAEPRVTTLTIVGDVVPAFTVGGAAQGAVVFEHDAFQVEGADGPVHHAFRFQNQGETPFRIRSATTSAGERASVVFPDRPVFARDVAGIVVMIEDPAAVARPDGTFDVEITQETTDAAQPTKTLRITGTLATVGG